MMIRWYKQNFFEAFELTNVIRRKAGHKHRKFAMGEN